jgi:hypothetical protein
LVGAACNSQCGDQCQCKGFCVSHHPVFSQIISVNMPFHSTQVFPRTRSTSRERRVSQGEIRKKSGV